MFTLSLAQLDFINHLAAVGEEPVERVELQATPYGVISVRVKRGAHARDTDWHLVNRDGRTITF